MASLEFYIQWKYPARINTNIFLQTKTGNAISH